MATIASGGKIETYLGAKAESLLGFKSPKIAKEACKANKTKRMKRLSVLDNLIASKWARIPNSTVSYQAEPVRK